MAKFGTHLALAQQYAREVNLSLSLESGADAAALSPELSVIRPGKEPVEFGTDFYVTLNRLGVPNLAEWSVQREMYGATLLLGIAVGVAAERQGRLADFPAEVEVLAKEIGAR